MNTIRRNLISSLESIQSEILPDIKEKAWTPIRHWFDLSALTNKRNKVEWGLKMEEESSTHKLYNFNDNFLTIDREKWYSLNVGVTLHNFYRQEKIFYIFLQWNDCINELYPIIFSYALIFLMNSVLFRKQMKLVLSKMNYFPRCFAMLFRQFSRGKKKIRINIFIYQMKLKEFLL